MKLNIAVSVFLFSTLNTDAFTFRSTPLHQSSLVQSVNRAHFSSSLLSTVAPVEETDSTEKEISTYDGVNQLTFRELQAECKQRGLEAVGNTRVLRRRLLENLGLCEGEEECTNLVRFCLIWLTVCV